MEPVDLAAILECAVVRERYFHITAGGFPSGMDAVAMLREAHADVAALVEEVERLRTLLADRGI